MGMWLIYGRILVRLSRRGGRLGRRVRRTGEIMLASGFTPPAAGARVARRAYIWQITCHIIRICTNMVTPINQPKPEKEPIIAWHLVMCMYGFWLPNDPRGSWSHYVGSKSLYDLGGPATGGQHRRSVAAMRHDHLLRVAVKAALKFPPVTLFGIQARAVGRGLAQAQRDGKYQIYACAIMPDHVHIVLRCPSRTLGITIGHFKAQATRRLNEEGISPCPKAAAGQDQPAVWGEGKWCGYLNKYELPRAVAYVEANPIKAGLPPQKWNFVIARP